jgi:predicted ATPase
VEQEVCFTDDYMVHWHEGNLVIAYRDDRNERHAVKAHLYGNSPLSDLRIIVGKTGSGKTNLLQLIGMNYYTRSAEDNNSGYLMLYKMEDEDSFLCETVNMSVRGLSDIHQDREYYFRENAYLFKYDFEHARIYEERVFNRRNNVVDTYIVNSFDRFAFAHCPYPDERDDTENEGMSSFLYRRISPFGRGSAAAECEYLKDYLHQFSEDSLKRQAELVIEKDNWKDVLKNRLRGDIMSHDYWTYQERAEQDRMNRMGKGEGYTELRYPEGTTPKSRFIHDLMTDFAIYLRKWAVCVGKRKEWGLFQFAGFKNPRELPEMKNISVMERINWLCQYIDWHSGDEHGNKGMMWQIGDDIKDISDILQEMPEAYFTDEVFHIPVMEIDTTEGSPIQTLFERMDNYIADDIGIFTKELLPYHWTCVSSGEYQYAKVWGVFYEYSVKVRIGGASKRYEDSIVPNLIVLMDEPESYMHPELCRTFIKKMNEIMGKRSDGRALQVIMSTHSPFMLSDVMSDQVIKMDVDEHGLCQISQDLEKPYFAANIHSIMADGFFLNYTIGENARAFLSDKFRMLKELVGKELDESDRREIEGMKLILPMIGDEMIRYSFEQLIRLADDPS